MREPLESYTTSEEDLEELTAIAELCERGNYTTLIALMHWLTDYLQELPSEQDLTEFITIAELCHRSSYTTMTALMHWLIDYLQELYEEAND